MISQVLRLYEAKVLDSIQFLFDLGFVPRIALPYRGPLDRADVVEALRRQIDGAGQGVPLQLEARPRDGADAAAAEVLTGVAPGAEEGQGSPAVGLRVLSTSR